MIRRKPAPLRGLQRIDHIALGLAPDQFDTWTLFSHAVLGLERGESLELADPFGLVRTSSVANDDRSVRFVFNVSQSQRTRTAQQVHATGRYGSGVQHIAFATADIFATAVALRRNGVRFVSISANYYDDLLARLALDEALVRRCRASTSSTTGRRPETICMPTASRSPTDSSSRSCSATPTTAMVPSTHRRAWQRRCNHRRIRPDGQRQSSLSSVIGRSRTRLPVALKTALATAAGTPVMPISPMPLTPSEFT